MNCKPRDLAIIFTVPRAEFESTQRKIDQYIGKVVRVLAIVGINDVWRIEDPVLVPGLDPLTAVEDRYLRPITGLPINDEVTRDMEVTA